MGNLGLLRDKVVGSQRRAWPCRSSVTHCVGRYVEVDIYSAIGKEVSECLNGVMEVLRLTQQIRLDGSQTADFILEGFGVQVLAETVGPGPTMSGREGAKL